MIKTDLSLCGGGGGGGGCRLVCSVHCEIINKENNEHFNCLEAELRIVKMYVTSCNHASLVMYYRKNYVCNDVFYCFESPWLT